MNAEKKETFSPNSGIYVLAIEAKKPFKTGIKKYERLVFQPGWYYYAGSAQKNLRQRLARHIRKDKKIHWHIDHITTVPSNKVEHILLLKDAPKEIECELANYFEKQLKLDSSIQGFGNSDSNCSSTHLFYSKKKIDYSHLFSLYQSTVLLMPSGIDISDS